MRENTERPSWRSIFIAAGLFIIAGVVWINITPDPDMEDLQIMVVP